MAAGIPLEKAQDYLNKFNALLLKQERVDPFTEKKIREELSSSPTTATNIALSYLDALTGKMDSALRYLRVSLEVNDVNLAMHYHHILLSTFSYTELRDVCAQLAKKYRTKLFSHNAYSWAYRYGEREQLEFYMDEHIKLLSEAEGRGNAMKHKEELLAEMDGFYNATQCSKEQFKTLASIIWTLLSEYKADTGFVQLSGSGCYVVDVKNLDSNVIAKMNFDLADRVCAESRLEDSLLLARFTSPRQLHTGVSYHVGD
ncbi:TPA: hypothetical protein U2Q62_004838 [Citrobacter amalonaticus]|uniref:hypothetical protein n=1 Tax=Citrobacter amalonaticus TaxID=35703 RepID=UPI002879180F|nr:hypothetical protein [Citrobacter amalonaticus]MDS4039390.1 hypothetical protein [Citrobacter amalonaticus]HED3078950.1 hypothetical protein [Citrobacter amalonaticus]HED3672365.1 hypothetical protein [Citrobacter amalonaticus]HED3698659.1 hypothetical protein [Citrobacter amalonaticus]HEM8625205.1 hypothetical protein [Citrobacter amalonaticus]